MRFGDFSYATAVMWPTGHWLSVTVIPNWHSTAAL